MRNIGEFVIESETLNEFKLNKFHLGCDYFRDDNGVLCMALTK